MRRLSALLLVLSIGVVGAVAACSGGDDKSGDAGPDATADGPAKKDAGQPQGDAAVTCNVDPSYPGTVTDQSTTYTPTPVDGGSDAATDAADDGSADGGADADDGSADDGSADAGAADGGGPIGGPEDSYEYQGSLNADPDILDIQLYAGFGVFANGITTGTFDLKGDELDYATCGVCVLVYPDGGNGDTYMATGGTVTLTSVQPTFAGTLTNVTLTHVTIDESTFESTPLDDGCNTSIAAASFSAPVTLAQQ